MAGDAPIESVSTQGNAANPPTSQSGGDPVASSGYALPYESRNHAESIQDTMNERAAAAPQAKPFDSGKVDVYLVCKPTRCRRGKGCLLKAQSRLTFR